MNIVGAVYEVVYLLRNCKLIRKVGGLDKNKILHIFISVLISA